MDYFEYVCQQACIHYVNTCFLLFLLSEVHEHVRTYMYRAIERNNLLNMVKLTVKALIESSMRFGRTLTDDHPPLQQLLIVVELILKHRLKGIMELLWFLQWRLRTYIHVCMHIAYSAAWDITKLRKGICVHFARIMCMETVRTCMHVHMEKVVYCALFH